MKKKLFFVLLLSGSMFLNFNIADAKGSTESILLLRMMVVVHHWNQLLIGNY